MADLSNATIDNTFDPIKLKMLALKFKKEGDITNAKAALIKAKNIIKNNEAAPQPPQPSSSSSPPKPKPSPLLVAKKPTPVSIPVITPALTPVPPAPAPTPIPVFKPSLPPVENKTNTASPSSIPTASTPIPKPTKITEGIEPSTIANDETEMGNFEPDPTLDVVDYESDPELPFDYDMADDADLDLEAELNGETNPNTIAKTSTTDAQFSISDLLDIDALIELTDLGFPPPTLLDYSNHVEALMSKGLDKEASELKSKGAEYFASLSKSANSLDDVNNNNTEMKIGDYDITPNELVDPSSLYDLLLLGQLLPPDSYFTNESSRLRNLAIVLKKEGDNKGAIAALKESKVLITQGDNVKKARGMDGSEDGGTSTGDIAMDEALRELMKEDELGGEDEGGMEELMSKMERVMNIKEKTVKSLQGKKIGKVGDDVPASTVKTADEWKSEAIKHKLEGSLKEAASAFRSYKTALANELIQLDKARVENIVIELRNELKACESEIKKIRYLDVFGGNNNNSNNSKADEMRIRWEDYSKSLGLKINFLDSAEASSNKVDDLVRNNEGLSRLTFNGEVGEQDVINCIVSSGGGELLDVGIIDLLEMTSNPIYAKHVLDNPESDIDVRVLVNIDLPYSVSVSPEEEDGKSFLSGVVSEEDGKKRLSEKDVLSVRRGEGLDVKVDVKEGKEKRNTTANNNKNRDSIKTESKKSISINEQQPQAPATIDVSYIESFTFGRSNDKLAKMQLKRMLRKKVEILIFLSTQKEKIEKRWFSSVSSLEEGNPKFLGRVSLEMKEFLSCRVAVGELCLTDHKGRKELGGKVRLGVRSGKRYGAEEEKGLVEEEGGVVGWGVYEGVEM